MAKNFFGIDAKLYRNTGTFGSPVWNEVPNCKDLGISLEAAEADVTTRESGGWEAVLSALKKATIDWKMVYDTTDADWTAFRDAFLNRTSIELLILDGAVGTSGSQGLRVSVAVLNFGRTENLEEALITEVSVKPTRADNAPSWHTVP